MTSRPSRSCDLRRVAGVARARDLRRAAGCRNSRSPTGLRSSSSPTAARRSSRTCCGTASAPPTSRAGKSGIAHFLEHLMFKGTAKNPAGRFSQQLASHRRAGERLHLLRLHRLLPARRARASRHADGVRGRPHDRPRPRPTTTCCPSATSSSKSATSASTTIRAARSPSRCRPRYISIILITGRPSAGVTRWRRSTARTRSPSTSASTRPNNAVLVVAGDVTADEVKALAEKTYGKIARERRRSRRARARRSRRRSPSAA